MASRLLVEPRFLIGLGQHQIGVEIIFLRIALDHRGDLVDAQLRRVGAEILDPVGRAGVAVEHDIYSYCTLFQIKLYLKYNISL